jgi:oxygen-independent coproporphyrinogen-3 oxidase
MGINRLSIGVQSLDDELLQLIGRRHTAEQARKAVATAQAAGFDNISIDLMYALPSQTMEQWQKDVAEALQMGVQHISTYGLIYEEGTVLMTLLDHGVIEAVDEDTEMQMYDYLVEQLVANGYEHYEVSNFALPGRRSKHNSSYWNDTPYVGLGAGAHSYDGQVRSWNISDLDQYIAQALAHDPEHKNEISGLMIMGLFGGTIFPLAMGFMSDAMGTLGAVIVMIVGAAYLAGFTLKIKK